MALRLVFMGTPAFAVPALDALVAAGHDVACVYCQPARAKGRGKAKQAGAVEKAARRHGIEVRTPESLKGADVQKEFAALESDAAVVAAYGLILPAAMLAAPRLGCFNIHASLLPRWRGAAPIARAIEAGDTETGVTIMAMEEGLDSGPILLAERVSIAPHATAGELGETLAALGARLVVTALEMAERGTLQPTPQPEEGVTYAAKLERAEERLDFSAPAPVVERKIRAFSPEPGTWFSFNNDRIRVLAAQAQINGISAAPGTVLDDRLLIACGEGALRPAMVQRAGRAAMPLDVFLRGYEIPAGTVIGRPE